MVGQDYRVGFRDCKYGGKGAGALCIAYDDEKYQTFNNSGKQKKNMVVLKYECLIYYK